jgi:hypothetical protein
MEESRPYIAAVEPVRYPYPEHVTQNPNKMFRYSCWEYTTNANQTNARRIPCGIIFELCLADGILLGAVVRNDVPRGEQGQLFASGQNYTDLIINDSMIPFFETLLQDAGTAAKVGETYLDGLQRTHVRTAFRHVNEKPNMSPMSIVFTSAIDAGMTVDQALQHLDDLYKILGINPFLTENHPMAPA